jgi:hypothetical protein
MSCINISNDDYINLENQAIEAGLDPVSLQSKIILWQKNNNSNELPSFEEIRYYGNLNNNFKQNFNIKPGVEELFDSNPELANQVYEALEFENLIKPTDKIIWGHPAIGKTTAKEKNNFLDFDTDFKPLVAKKLGLPENQQNSISLNKWRETGNAEEFNKAMREVWAIAKTQAKEQNKILMVSDMIFLKENESDFDKIINIPDNVFTQRAFKRGDDVDSLQNWKNNINKVLNNIKNKSKIIITDKYLSDLFITPEQKQQALQQYSQYLDNIFPDSKVKDIVYHGSNNDIITFRKSENGIFFSNNLEDAVGTKSGKIIKTVLNIKNLFDVEKTNIRNKEISDLIKEGFDSKQYLYTINSNAIVVFEPEQIHILGSKQDMKGFKDYVNNQSNSTSQKSPILDIPNEIWNTLTEEEKNKILECN